MNNVYLEEMPHWHILLNHLPSVGMVIALGLYLTAYYKKSEDLNRSSLVLFALIGLFTIPVFVTGAGTKWAIQNMPDISLEMITAHQDAALLALIWIGITGCLAWFALWQYRRFSAPRQWVQWAVLISAVLSIGFMIPTGSLGGDINHPELRAAEEMVTQMEPGRSEVIREFILNTTWLWPALEAAHFVGMAVIFGVVLMISLRVLGFVKNLSYSAVHRLLPMGVLGLVVNVVTGMAFLIADAGRYTAIDGFYMKIALLVLAGVVALYFTIFDEPWSLNAGDNAKPIARILASLSILMWAGVLLLGRFLPYIEG